MKWVTLSHVHLDRVAAPWLIRRHVDPAAEFGFLTWGEAGELPTPGSVDVPADAIPFAIPGVELGLHDADGTCFAKILRAHDLDDPSLWAMERVVAAGVRHTFGHDPAADETPEETMLGGALNLLGAGLGIAFDDEAHLEVGFGLYDALHAHCRVRLLPVAVTADAPFLPPQKIPFMRAALARG